MAKRFNKEITTAEQKMAFEAVKACKEAMDKIDVEIKKQHAKASETEGKYAIGKENDAYYDPHFRSWHYVYATEADQDRERAEIKEISNAIVALQAQKYELMNQYETLQDALCITLWGYGIKTYNAYQALIAKRKQAEELRKELAELESEIALLENEIN